jgi:hypothetical protein
LRPIPEWGIVRRSHPQRRQAVRIAGPTAYHYDLVVNLSAAKALGLAIPERVEQIAADRGITQRLPHRLGSPVLLRTRAQQPAMPMIGYLSPGSPVSDGVGLTGLQRSANDACFADGLNIRI